MDDIAAKQGKHLTALLKKQGISQMKLAELVRVSPVTVSRWANGVSKMRVENAAAIARAFPPYSEAYILGYSDYVSEDIESAANGLKKAIRNVSHAEKVTGTAEDIAGYLGYKVSIEYDLFSVSPDDEPINIPVAVEVSKDGNAYAMPFNAWVCFGNEVFAYVDMRLGLMMGDDER